MRKKGKDDSFNSLDTYERQRLVLDNMRLVPKMGSRLLRNFQPADREDLTSRGIEGMVEAAQRFEPGIGVQFNTYAYKRVIRKMIEEVEASAPVRVERRTGSTQGLNVFGSDLRDMNGGNFSPDGFVGGRGTLEEIVLKREELKGSLYELRKVTEGVSLIGFEKPELYDEIFRTRYGLYDSLDVVLPHELAQMFSMSTDGVRLALKKIWANLNKLDLEVGTRLSDLWMREKISRTRELVEFVLAMN